MGLRSFWLKFRADIVDAMEDIERGRRKVERASDEEIAQIDRAIREAEHRQRGEGNVRVLPTPRPHREAR